MKFNLSYLLSAVALAASVGASTAYAAVVISTEATLLPSDSSNTNGYLVHFDDLSLRPRIFVAAAAQTINASNTNTINNITTTTPIAQFTGGTTLGLATFFPAITFASSPNVYGTADFGNSLSSTLNINFNSTALNTDHVSFALFNGETTAQSYIVTTTFADETTATTQFNNIAANWQSGYALVDLLFPALRISNIAINVVPDSFNTLNINTPSSKLTTWDFLIDDVAFNRNVANVVPSVTPPTNPVENQPVQVETLDPTVIESEKKIFVCDDKGRCKLTDDNQSSVRVFKADCKKCDQINFAENMQAVPEPETYAMMMAGLGVMGFIARRRKVA